VLEVRIGAAFGHVPERDTRVGRSRVSGTEIPAGVPSKVAENLGPVNRLRRFPFGDRPENPGKSAVTPAGISSADWMIESGSRP
jgi:hypothetical protein